MTPKVQQANVTMISAEVAWQLLCVDRSAPILDVRSPGEFAAGHFPGTHNVAILDDQQRAAVGLTYKEQGQAAAIELGHQLVDPSRANLVAAWQGHARQYADAVVMMCWRGGLRSQTAAQWLAETGCAVRVVRGGYKALRQIARRKLASPPTLQVISGYTGSGKTTLLDGLNREWVDLEGLAKHRGSAFGGLLRCEQPAQATFEHALAMAYRDDTKHLIVEDESRLIGRCALPESWVEAIRQASTIVVEVERDERALAIYDEYVQQPLSNGIASQDLAAHYAKALSRIKRKLGGERTTTSQQIMAHAFATGERSDHLAWISYLLEHYYDARYDYSLARYPRQVAYRGSPQACRSWMNERGSRA